MQFGVQFGMQIGFQFLMQFEVEFATQFANLQFAMQYVMQFGSPTSPDLPWPPMTSPPIQIGVKLQIWLQILEFAVQEILEFAVQEILEFRRFAKKVGF